LLKKRISSRIYKALYYLIPFSFLIGFLFTWFFLPSITKANSIKEPIKDHLIYEKLSKNQTNVLEPYSEKKSILFKLQHSSLTEEQIKVVNEMKHTWTAYKKYAWGRDHLKPISKTWVNFHFK
jgi:hypothetical protein